MTTRRRRSDDGAALVEFALILPILVMMLFGIIQFGLAYDAKQSVNSSARESARFGALPTSDVPSIKKRAVSAFAENQAGTLNPNDVDIWIDTNPHDMVHPEDGGPPIAAGQPCDMNAGDSIVVIVAKSHQIAIPLIGPINTTLESRGEFRCEEPAP